MYDPVLLPGETARGLDDYRLPELLQLWARDARRLQRLGDYIRQRQAAEAGTAAVLADLRIGAREGR
jgi:hypothetical protein